MRILRGVACSCLLFFFLPMHAAAQDPPPPIPRIVLDVRGSVPSLSPEPQLAESRGLLESELPGRGFGGDLGLHFRLFKWKALNLGLGGQLTLARGATSAEVVSGQTISRAVTERFTSATGQVSFNFGSGNGWSYISGGIGVAQRTVVPDGGEVTDVDAERLQTTNYGGGARWFIKPHLAFTFDVRFHDIAAGTVFLGPVASPRATLLILSAGVSFK